MHLIRPVHGLIRSVFRKHTFGNLVTSHADGRTGRGTFDYAWTPPYLPIRVCHTGGIGVLTAKGYTKATPLYGMLHHHHVEPTHFGADLPCSRGHSTFLFA